MEFWRALEVGQVKLRGAGSSAATHEKVGVEGQDLWAEDG